MQGGEAKQAEAREVSGVPPAWGLVSQWFIESVQEVSGSFQGRHSLCSLGMRNGNIGWGWELAYPPVRSIGSAESSPVF